jgi:hypothetical protein
VSSQQAQAEYGAFGDGVEISRLPGYLAGLGGLNGVRAGGGALVEREKYDDR